MTGFGSAATDADAVHYAVEIRSLNNRYFKVSFRLPDEISGLEPEFEAILRKTLQRGTITLVVRVKRHATKGYRVNDAALLAYMDHLKLLRDQVGDAGGQTSIDLTALLALPGVLCTSHDDSDEPLDRARPVLLPLVREACDRLVGMRRQEGEAIGAELIDHQQTIMGIVEKIAEQAPRVVEGYQQRLTTRITEMLAKAKLEVSAPDLIKEVAMFADRSDISEELSRLKVHLDHLKALIESDKGEPAGRTLDFLAQELLREANTIASKSNDASISHAVVEIKGIIDRIKEQVQNVE